MPEIAYALLCKRAEIEGGSHNVFGANLHAFAPASFPAVIPTLCVALGIRVEWREIKRQFPGFPATDTVILYVGFDLVDDQAHSLFSETQAKPILTIRPKPVLGQVRHDVQVVPISQTFEGMSVRQPGRYFVVISIDSVESARLPFSVVRKEHAIVRRGSTTP